MGVNFMSKKLSKKFLSSIAASMMVFGASPKSSAQTVKYSASYRNSNSSDIGAKSLVVAGVGLTAVASIVIAGMVISIKAYEKKMQERQDKINTSSPYIKNLAQNLKKILNDDLFDSLLQCRGDVELKIWQNNKILNYDLGANDLEKIINKLYNHWFSCYNYNSFYADAEVRALRNKHRQLVEEKRYEEHMRLLKERNRIEEEHNRIEKEKLKNMGNNLNYGVNQNISYKQNISHNYNFSGSYEFSSNN